ncbi:hypothetical protein AB0O01_06610 [Streptomyces sp. NPDC093252]|uniref:hypothetical protein n=1 Tax=Streptomyces sp. NPDC093252 TaxID=3154980 RepID=UPI00343085DD
MAYQLVTGDLPLELEGDFRPWAIAVGHSQVLLRGFLGGDDGENPRVFDVLFQDVSRISLADRYSGLVISGAGPEALRSEERRVGGQWLEAKLFRISAQHPEDYVIAGYVFWAEVFISAVEPSPLMQESPNLEEIKDGIVFRARWDR